jgi:glutamate formiminotransferase/formiminotetrahydrofolate cyclodeaminase
MTQSLVECIANFSEGRRMEVVDAIRQAITSVAEVSILDGHSDIDHNRTVITFVGAPDEIEEAAFRAIQKAAELIDLDQHSGEHPRIGASDVVPFVPISGVSMQDCVELARRLGKRVGEELHIPVYLYEEAATRPDRKNLEHIRRGEYEGLKEEIGTNPEREPDFGPPRLGPAGATVIGARQALIAYNVYLTTDEVSIAKKIARTIRHSSGGLRYVKALGLLVEGRAQVSMNLTNFHCTSIASVVEMIRREAARYGVGVAHSELVGLIPQEALVDTAVWYTQLDQFEKHQILEQRLAETRQAALEEETSSTMLGRMQAYPFLDALADGTPTPGGGSASAYSAAAGAALAAMVARLTIGKKKYTQVEEQMRVVLKQAEALRARLAEAIQRDAAAFEALMTAYRLPKESPEEKQARLERIEGATLGAAQVPLEVATMAVEVLELSSQVVAVGNLNAISDGGTGAALAGAALTGAGYNVRINLADLQDRSKAGAMVEKLQELEQRAEELQANIRSDLSHRGGLSLV